MKLTSHSAFESLFKEHYPDLVRYAQRMLSDRDAAEDAVQQVFVTLWEKREELDIEQSVNSYLLRSVHNACLNKLKQQQTHQRHQEEIKKTSSIEESKDLLEEEEFRIKVKSAVQKLPTECRRIFLMSRVGQKKYQEIADELGLSIKTIENQMGKALRILRSDLEEEVKETFRIIRTIFWLFIGVKLASIVIR